MILHRNFPQCLVFPFFYHLVLPMAKANILVRFFQSFHPWDSKHEHACP